MKLRTLTRLLIGGTLAGLDGLNRRLSLIESELNRKDTTGSDEPVVQISNSQNDSTNYQSDEETQGDRLRYTMIGLIFDTQESLSKGLNKVEQISYRAGGKLDHLVGPIYSSRLFSPIRTRVDKLAQRGQDEVERWIELGRKEEIHSRELANTALTEQVDNSIQYLASNPEVQELVQSHSVGLIGEIVEETRERTVSADYFIEAWARTIFRRPMRSDLPEPPQELKSRALPYRRIQGKIIKK